MSRHNRETFSDDQFDSAAPPFQHGESDEDGDDRRDGRHTVAESAVDDPVRIYLMQMGEIPMLNRREELSVARRIARSRRAFRNRLLATDYVLQAAIGLLEAVRQNKLRLDRTVEVSVINLREKSRLLKVLGPNLQTLHDLMLRNKRDFALAISRRQPTSSRRQAWRR